jgi:MFS family permease
MPTAARDLNGLSYYSWSFSAFLVGMLFSTVLAGRLSDRIGPARPLLAGLAVFAVGLVLAGSAQHVIQLVAGRLVQGLGSGLINTAIFVCVSWAYSDAQRPRMFTYISASWVLPAFVGPPVATAITERWSWHWVFLSMIRRSFLVVSWRCRSYAGSFGSRRAETNREEQGRHRCGLLRWSLLRRSDCRSPGSAWTGRLSPCWRPRWRAWSLPCRS